MENGSDGVGDVLTPVEDGSTVEHQHSSPSMSLKPLEASTPPESSRNTSEVADQIHVAPESPATGKPPPPPLKSSTMSPPIHSPSLTTDSPRSSTTSAPSARHSRALTLSQGPTVSLVLITSALDTIAKSREAKKQSTLKDAAQRALDMVNTGRPELFEPRVLFEPLRIACETGNEKLMIASLDCIAKLISYSFFAEPEIPQQPYVSPPTSPATSTHPSSQSLADHIAHTITSAYTENTPDTVALQIVKALLALVLSTTIVVHHSSLLRAVRTIYNVFLLSPNPSNQLVAQGGLTQIVHHVFSRCQTQEKRPHEDNGSRYSSPKPEKSPILTPESLPLPPMTPSETTTPDTPDIISPTKETRLGTRANAISDGPSPLFSDSRADIDDKLEGSLNQQEMAPHAALDNLSHAVDIDEMTYRNMSANDLHIKDAYLVFRALSKLSMKTLVTESERDLKSHGMRSKLLSLHLLLTILNSYAEVFVSPRSLLYSGSSGEATQFLQATKQYLCLSISRNAISSVPQVFEISVEIFWKVLSGMRSKLKKEIEVLMNEIFLPMLEMRTSTLKQKTALLNMLSRLSQDAQALVDVYINYDCDSDALENIYERLINIISKIGSVQPSIGQTKGEYGTVANVHLSKDAKTTVPPSLSTSALAISSHQDAASPLSSERTLRRQALECLVAVLRSLVSWGTTLSKNPTATTTMNGSKPNNSSSAHMDADHPASVSTDRLSTSTPDLVDDPNRFENAKHRKTLLLEGIKKFKFKPKKGVEFLIENGFMGNGNPADVAYFLMTTDGLSKAMIGEYLGEGDEENVATMHAFVDLLDFTGLPFTEALRSFLQSFRLPGEAQKIDRFMLKFAERYMECNSDTAFKNAEAAYVLAYSVILLNTDAHNPQVKKRMSNHDFIRNNRGINDGSDLSESLLDAIYLEIQNNEIKMKDEVETEALLGLANPSSIASSIANVGRDMQREAYLTQTTGILHRTEAMFKTMTLSKGHNEQFFSATHIYHVKPMFEVAWMSFLAGLSGPLQDTDDLDIVELSLDGFKSSIRIACFYDLDLPRTSFVTTLTKFTFLNNLGEMKIKNMEAIKTLLDVAVNEGNNLKGCWRDVLMCVSQLERMQLIGSSSDAMNGRRSRKKLLVAEELANESRSTHITVAADMVFSLSHYLSGTAIVDFVRALSEISWEEIQSSGTSETPRLFSLQKLVEISYYNMNRIRLEWSNMWSILGEHFNMTCCHQNPHVAFFALDALRQLAMRFLEKEELSHFKFQKDFLRPFEHAMTHNLQVDVRDMVLQCLQQMIQARVQNLRSGWRTMFGVFSAASRTNNERIATNAFELVTRINAEHFDRLVHNGAFADMTVCITDFCKANRFQKINLLAIAMLRDIIPTMLRSPECCQHNVENGSHVINEDPSIKFWFPVLFSFYDIIMNGEDLEVRQMALDSLFSALKSHGSTFPPDFWDVICKELLFPIFAVLKSPSDVSRFSTQEDMSVWFSTTMVEALRNVIDLYTHYFNMLERTFDGLLDLLCVCICQENDTIARIGTSCLQKLLENNVKHFSLNQWEKVTMAFVTLFKMTTPHQLFEPGLRVEIPSSNGEANIADGLPSTTVLPAPLDIEPISNGHAPNSPQARRRVFQQIIVKCVLQLLLIETTHELLQNAVIYENIPPEELLRLLAVLDQSYQFARTFNEDKDLRTGLWRVGFMKHLPNLLKQESASAGSLVHISMRMYHDPRAEYRASRGKVAERLVPLGIGITQDYIRLKVDTNMKSILAWSPVVADFVRGISTFEEATFKRYLPAIHPLIVELLAREISSELRDSIRAFFARHGASEGFSEYKS